MRTGRGVSGRDPLRREFLRFGMVGAAAWVVDTAVFVGLKTTLLEEKPVSAKVIAVLVATVVSYVLNREWSFRTRGGRRRGSEATLFFAVSLTAVGLYAAPLWISRYVLGLETPAVSPLTEHVADLVAGQVVGVLFGMGFRWWAFRRFVFPIERLTVDTVGHCVTRSADEHLVGVQVVDRDEAAPNVTVIVPTRNEEETVGVCLARLTASLATTSLSYEVVVVDDSDDATPAVLNSLAEEYPALRLLHRAGGDRVGGLSGAITAGFATALGTTVVVMDADLQHPPEEVPGLVGQLLGAGADVCVASRYVEGGSAGGLDGPWRRCASFAARAVVHLLIPATRSVTDPCSGFFAVRRRILHGATLEAEGFKILVEILARTSWTGAVEIPYTFETRLGGRSNFSHKEIARFARHMSRLTRTLRDSKLTAYSPE